MRTEMCCPDGKWGELVITTIGMEAQPLIRYEPVTGQGSFQEDASVEVK